ncbi:MAG: hypothetical protein CM1200mP1_06300 [Candidatus Neomarinimicrobiota bacterium]|nr:MAG: hypothetical protein CM1200mP1_06300 [Candidatus Neomarinimicrobiota bacterium]
MQDQLISQKKSPNDINAVLMAGVSDSLSLDENKNLTDYLERGGNLFLTQNRIKTNLQVQQAFPIESDIFSIIKKYGFSIEENLVKTKYVVA